MMNRNNKSYTAWCFLYLIADFSIFDLLHMKTLSQNMTPKSLVCFIIFIFRKLRKQEIHIQWVQGSMIASTLPREVIDWPMGTAHQQMTANQVQVGGATAQRRLRPLWRSLTKISTLDSFLDLLPKSALKTTQMYLHDKYMYNVKKLYFSNWKYKCAKAYMVLCVHKHLIYSVLLSFMFV